MDLTQITSISRRISKKAPNRSPKPPHSPVHPSNLVYRHIHQHLHTKNWNPRWTALSATREGSLVTRPDVLLSQLPGKHQIWSGHWMVNAQPGDVHAGTCAIFNSDFVQFTDWWARSMEVCRCRYWSFWSAPYGHLRYGTWVHWFEGKKDLSTWVMITMFIAHMSIWRLSFFSHYFWQMAFQLFNNYAVCTNNIENVSEGVYEQDTKQFKVWYKSQADGVITI